MNWTFDHRPRRITPAGRFDRDGWRLKLYAVEGKGRAIDPELMRAAHEVIAKTLPQPAATHARYGIGFAIVHEADAFNTVTVDWWEEVNELRHRVFRATPNASLNLREITASGEAVCTWELRVMAFERERWLEVLASSDFERYLASWLSTGVES